MDATGLMHPRARVADCRLAGVVDGDTVRLFCAGLRTERARLVDFDTPEVFSPGCFSEWVRGVHATWALRVLIWRAREVRLTHRGHDRYGRRLVLLRIDGQSAGRIMVRTGLARPYAGGRRADWCGSGGPILPGGKRP